MTPAGKKNLEMSWLNPTEDLAVEEVGMWRHEETGEASEVVPWCTTEDATAPGAASHDGIAIIIANPALFLRQRQVRQILMPFQFQ